jgi:hypothetical protein
MDGARLTVENRGGPELVRPVPVLVRAAGLTAELAASIDGRDHELAVDRIGDGLGRVLLPA